MQVLRNSLSKQLIQYVCPEIGFLINLQSIPENMCLQRSISNVETIDNMSTELGGQMIDCGKGGVAVGDNMKIYICISRLQNSSIMLP